MDREKRKEYYKNWRLKNKDKVNELKRQFRLKNPESVKRSMDKWTKKNRGRRGREYDPLKDNARYKVFLAKKKRLLIPPLLCEDCKTEKKLEAHHKDYTKPLKVIWLCRLCHSKADKQLKNFEPLALLSQQ